MTTYTMNTIMHRIPNYKQSLLEWIIDMERIDLYRLADIPNNVIK